MKSIFIILTLFVSCFAYSQQRPADDNEELNSIQLEDLSESEDAESEDDYSLQQMSVYKRHPLNINGPESSLEEFPMLDPLLISNLIQYRSLLGNLINVYELQAVPGFTAGLIQKLIPYITLSDTRSVLESLLQRFSQGESSITMRPVFIPQLADGFVEGSSTKNKFTGSRPSLFFRYQYQFRDLLQYGITGDKDTGEPWLTGKHNLPMDFQSFHFFVRRAGCVKSFALGDYTVNLGQGLIHWQSQAFKKTSGVTNIKRQSEVLRPYHSAGEYNFHRGAAITISKYKWEATLFVSIRKLSANVEAGAITSFLTSGLNRTAGEIEDKNKVGELFYGGNIKKILKKGHAGLNFTNYLYSMPIKKREDPYNKFAIKGIRWLNYSLDYSYTVRNLHFFGETAGDVNTNKAFINGMIASISQAADIAILHRFIDRRYQAIYANAFTENTLPNNENGFYTGLSLKPDHRWKLDLYADLFSFPWLKYRVSSPSRGVQYLVQLTWKPDKKVEVYTRFRMKMKPINIDSDHETDFTGDQSLKNWRTQVSYQINPSILLRNRVEVCSFIKEGIFPESGYLFYTDLLCKPLGKWYSGNIRFMRFETGSYDSRIYAYENDLPYVSATPSFSDEGIRYYLNLKGKFNFKYFRNSQLVVGIKLASTLYAGKTLIGSGLSAIQGNRKSDIKMQVILVPKA
jgi:hypothetical protein